MENRKSPNNEAFEKLAEVWGESMIKALPAQDLQLAEACYTKAYAVSEYLQANSNDEEEREFTELIFLQICLVKEFLSIIFFLGEQRDEKAKESLSNGMSYAEKSLEIFSRLIGSSISEDEEVGAILNINGLNAKFFRFMLMFQKSEMDLDLRLRGNNYVDEIQERKDNVALLKKYFEEPWSDYDNEFYHMHCALIKRLIDRKERMIERLERDFNKISYIRPKGNELFIVHGHDEALLLELKQMLSDSFDLKPIILRDQMGDGLTVIEKFEKYAIKSSFVFVLLTPDDFVSKDDEKYYQGRPNVLFELGWFYGRLGREKVRILKKKNTAIPSDLAGIVSIDFNEKIEEVYRKIKATLEFAGLLGENKKSS